MEAAKVELTQEVADDINHIMGASNTVERYIEEVGNCFSTVDYDDPACQKCIVQIS